MNLVQEITIFARYDDFISKGDAHNAAMMNVRIWGQGTQGNDGRLSRLVGDKIFEWCRMIAQREIAGNGSSAIPSQDPSISRRSQQKGCPISTSQPWWHAGGRMRPARMKQ